MYKASKKPTHTQTHHNYVVVGIKELLQQVENFHNVGTRVRLSQTAMISYKVNKQIEGL